MVLVFFAQGFEELEAIAAVDILRRAGIPVQTVGVDGKEIPGAHGITVECDIRDTQADPGAVEMIVLPGGGQGMRNLDASRTVHGFIAHCVQNDRPMAAICASPVIYGRLGLLEGKKATCYPGMEGELAGAEYTGADVETSGRITTGRSPGTATAFALELVRVLRGSDAAERVAGELKI